MSCGLGGSKRPAVLVTLDGYTYRSTENSIALMREGRVR